MKTIAFILINLIMTNFALAENKTVKNSISQEFVLIPAGAFVMGSPESFNDSQPGEKPQHKVSISKPFYIGKYEVTQAEWEKVMGSNPYDQSRSNPFINTPGMRERITKPDHPATVSWEDAQEFIKKLNQKEGGSKYRLPTEAEWEYAARAGTSTTYSFGEKAKDLDQYAWFGENFATGGTHPVGKKKPNPWGLYDVHGNAWEWVQDFYSSDYYSKSPALDPAGPKSGSGHVVRGGSWHSTSDGWHSAIRKEYAPDYRGISIGFRLVRNVE